MLSISIVYFFVNKHTLVEDTTLGKKEAKFFQKSILAIFP
jgi:hypothetical protein